MAKTYDKLGSARRFGTRYGRTVKYTLARIEAEQRASTKCPFCLYNKVSRKAAGIFECSKCRKKFTGKAYTIAPIKSLVQQAQISAAEDSFAKEDLSAVEEEFEEVTV